MKMAKRSISILILLMVFSLAWVAPALACDMRLNPDRSEVTAGDTVQFTLERYQTHKICSVPLEATKITVTGGTLVDPGVWQPGTPDILVFTVRFDQPGTGVVTVTRTCDKTPNLSVSSSIEVKAAPEAILTVQKDVKVTADPSKTGKKNGSDSGVTSTPALNTAPPVASSASNVAAAADASKASWLPAWLLIDSNWAWWSAFLLLALGLYLLKLEPFRRPLLLASLVVLGFYLGACPCPMGSIFKLFINSVSVVLLLVLATSLIWGRFFCGWICPMGAVQAFFRARGLNWQIPKRADQILKSLKYLVLAGFILAAAWTGTNAWIDYDPFKALFNFNWAMPATIILIAVLAGNLLVERFFCRYLCPLGAVLAIINRIRSLFGGGTRIENCTGCQKCVKQGCPMGALNITGEGKEARVIVDSAECISCRSCQGSCNKQCIQMQ